MTIRESYGHKKPHKGPIIEKPDKNAQLSHKLERCVQYWNALAIQIANTTKSSIQIFPVLRCTDFGLRLHMIVCHLFKPIKTNRLLLVKRYDNKMVSVTLQLSHLSGDSASGG